MPHFAEPLEPRRLRAATLAYDLTADGLKAHDFVRYGGGVAMVGHSAANGSELWTTDGTTAGTRLLVDLAAGPASSDAKPVAGYGRSVLFTAKLGRQEGLWATDGSVASTRLLVPMDYAHGLTAFGNFTQLGSTLLFTRYSTRYDKAELWRTDGTAGGTFLLFKDIPADQGDVYLSQAGRWAYFVASKNGGALCRTDGTRSGTGVFRGILDVAPGQGVGSDYVCPLVTAAGGVGLYAVPAGHGAPKLIHAFADLVVLAADAPGRVAYVLGIDTPRSKPQLYRYDGRTLTAVAFPDAKLLQHAKYSALRDGSIYVAYKDTLYGVGPRGRTLAAIATAARDRAGRDTQITRVNVADDGTVLVRRALGNDAEVLRLSRGRFADLGPVAGDNKNFAVVGNHVFFMRDDATELPELWTAGTNDSVATQLSELTGGPGSSNVRGMAALGGGLFVLTARTTPGATWSDSTKLHTVGYLLGPGRPATPAFTIDTYSGEDSADTVFDAGGVAYFTVATNAYAYTSVHGAQGTDLYRTDGTAAGTVRAAQDVARDLRYLGRAGGYAFFRDAAARTTLAVPLRGHGPVVTASTPSTPYGDVVAAGDTLYSLTADNNILAFDGATGTSRLIDVSATTGTDTSPRYLVAWRNGPVLVTGTGNAYTLTGDETLSLRMTFPMLLFGDGQRRLVADGDVLWAVGGDGNAGAVLRKIDLAARTVTDTATLSTTSNPAFVGTPGDANFGRVGAKLLVAMSRGGHTGLFLTDGTDAGTTYVPDSDGPHAVQSEGALLFFKNTSGDLQRSDGEHTIAVAGNAAAAGPVTTIGPRTYFLATDRADGREVWADDHPDTALRGSVFADTNADGTRGTTEAGLAGWRVFLDADGDGVWRRSEPSVLTDADGRYAFAGLPEGRYAVAVTHHRRR